MYLRHEVEGGLSDFYTAPWYEGDGRIDRVSQAVGLALKVQRDVQRIKLEYHVRDLLAV